MPLFLLALACVGVPPSPAEEIAAARVLFDANIQAIQARDREAYLACYARTDRLIRTGPDGPALGYADLATSTPATGSSDWPERLEAEDLQVHWLGPGVVYGTYRYTVTIAGETTSGVSERVFLRQADGDWAIAVSTAFPVSAAEE